MDSARMDGKLRQVFAKFSQPGYKPSNNFYLESLLTHLSEKNPDGEDIVQLPSVSAWLLQVAREWAPNFQHCGPHLKSFALRLLAVASQKPDTFQLFMQNNVYDSIFDCCKLNDEKNPSVKLGFLKVLMSTTEHAAGLRWIVDKDLWRDAVLHCQGHQTVYLARHGCEFVSTLLWKLSDSGDDKSCEDILVAMVTPIINNDWKSATVIHDEEHSKMDTALIPALTSLAEVLQDVPHFGTSSAVVRALTDKLNLDPHLFNLFNLSRSPALVGCISKLLYLIRVAKVYSTKNGIDEIGQRDSIEFCLVYSNLVFSLLSKRDPDTVLHLSHFCFVYMSKVREHHKLSILVEKENGCFELTNQMIVISLLPVLCSLKMDRCTFVDEYVAKLISISCEQTTRMAYTFRDLIREKNDPKVAVKAIQYAIAAKKYLDKSQAVTIFQSFFYGLQEFVPDYSETAYVVVGVDGWEATNLISKLLDAIFIYIEEFDIIWQDSVEVLCVHNFCTRIIKTSNLSPKLVIQAFKLAQMTIRKFLSPNLALLMNSSHGSVIEEIDRNIYEKLHDVSWEIRDSAMELLCIVADIALSKFPAFQQQVAAQDLPRLVLTLAAEDAEPYVRASALRCLAAMVHIPCVWDGHLQFLQLPTKMMKVLQDESEGLVRKEACDVMLSLYELQRFPALLLDAVFLAMHRAAVADLHWEVQLAALRFWAAVIHSQTQHQGMIDGVFPSVTFSKENRKIVELNEKEIRKRLKKILNELALRGCLGALLTCLNDEEADLQVTEKALEVVNRIVNLLDRYDVRDLNGEDGSSPSARPVIDEKVMKDHSDMAKMSVYRNRADIKSETNNIVMDNGKNSESVIESIVNADDVNLLADVYAHRLKVDHEHPPDREVECDPAAVAKMYVEPELFLRTVRQTDYRRLIDEKLRWRESIATDIDSLFEDILATYKDTEVNSMDCY